jgi:hypothetical protein
MTRRRMPTHRDLALLAALGLVLAACASVEQRQSSDPDPVTDEVWEPVEQGPRTGRWRLVDVTGAIAGQSGGADPICGEDAYTFRSIQQLGKEGELFNIELLDAEPADGNLTNEWWETYVEVTDEGEFYFSFVFLDTPEHYQEHSNLPAAPAHLGEAVMEGAWTWLPNRAAGRIGMTSPMGRSTFEVDGRFIDAATLAGEWRYESVAQGIADCWSGDRGSGTWRATAP